MSLRLLAILAIACGTRLVYALFFNAENYAIHVDAMWYDDMARSLLAGKGFRGRFGAPTAFFPPGYPALLAVAYGAFGTSFVVARALNCVLATLTCALVYAIGRRAYGEAVGLVGAALFAVFPGDIFYASLTLSEPAFSFALCACILLFLVWNDDRKETPALRWLCFGLLLGASALIRGIALLFLVVPISIWLLQLGAGRATLVRSSLAVLGVALAVAPWTLRNAWVLGYPVLIASDGPMALLIAHHPDADGSQSEQVWKYRKQHYGEALALPAHRSEGEVARQDLRHALRFALTHPLEELALVPRRLYHLLRDDHYALRFSTTAGSHPRRPERSYRRRKREEFAPVAAVADVWFFAVLALAALGAVRASTRRDRASWIVPLTPLFVLLTHGFVFWGDPRFHASFVPMLCILAALGMQPRRPAPTESSAP